MHDGDFTSALYLGLSHPSGVLPEWSALTTGTAAVIRESAIGLSVAAGVAALVGAGAGVVGPSTLHLSLDLFRLLAGSGGSIFADAALYDIGAWGVDHATLHGARAHRFAAHSPDALRRAVQRDAPYRRPFVVATDGLCPSCGRLAPLTEYVAIAREHGGILVVDDTQALGVLGTHPDANQPFGYGGGGTLPHLGISGADVIVMSSLAKGFGAPTAVLAGSTDVIRRFRRDAATRAHCSAPSAAVLLAALRALRINARHGDALRRRLADNIARFRDIAAPSGFSSTRWHFPVQSLTIPVDADPRAIQRALDVHGIQTVLTRDARGRSTLTFLITAAHQPRQVERAANLAIQLLSRAGPRVARYELAHAV